MINKKPYEVRPWNSLAGLIDDFSIAELVDTIEREGVYVWDQYGRIILAEKDTNDHRSTKKALDQLADVYHAQQNPEPYDPSLDDFDRSDQDPLNMFGWPGEKFPEIRRNSVISRTIDKTKPWKELAREVAEELYQKTKKATGFKGNLDDYCAHVEEVFKTESIKSAHGEVPSKGNIKREALQGDHWWSSKK